MHIEVFLKAKERWLLLAFCMIAIARVFFYSAAFPLFNNVDEQAHFDTVVKYSHGKLPTLDSIYFDRESSEFIALYGSPEYVNEFQYGKIPLPFWYFEDKRITNIVEKMTAVWLTQENHEVLSPPVYYILAGAWYSAGKFLGISGLHLLYWVRFLNIPLYAVLLWYTYLFCNLIFADAPSSRICVLFLVAVFPQDVFYSIINDVLSPVLCLVAFYYMLLIIRKQQTVWCHIIAGCAVAGAFLVKYSNLPVLLVLFFILIIYMKRLLREERLRTQIPNLSLLLFSAIVPIAWWLGRNSIVLHDITGNEEKVRSLGWVIKPFSEMIHHPMFSFSGLAYFFSELLKTFWRGEFVWGLKRIAMNAADDIYVSTSCVFIALNFFRFITWEDEEKMSRHVIGASLSMLILSVLFLSILSIIYDFGDCWYPSHNQPYFTSGRLILGIFIPFIVLYVAGIRYIEIHFKRRYLLLITVMLLSLVSFASEIILSYHVFYSYYNWFHLSSLSRWF